MSGCQGYRGVDVEVTVGLLADSGILAMLGLNRRGVQMCAKNESVFHH